MVWGWWGQGNVLSRTAIPACHVVDADPGDRWCRRCGYQGVVRDSVVRRLVHEPFGWRPTTLMVTVRRSAGP